MSWPSKNSLCHSYHRECCDCEIDTQKLMLAIPC